MVHDLSKIMKMKWRQKWNFIDLIILMYVEIESGFTKPFIISLKRRLVVIGYHFINIMMNVIVITKGIKNDG